MVEGRSVKTRHLFPDESLSFTRTRSITPAWRTAVFGRGLRGSRPSTPRDVVGRSVSSSLICGRCRRRPGVRRSSPMKYLVVAVQVPHRIGDLFDPVTSTAGGLYHSNFKQTRYHASLCSLSRYRLLRTVSNTQYPGNLSTYHGNNL